MKIEYCTKCKRVHVKSLWAGLPLGGKVELKRQIVQAGEASDVQFVDVTCPDCVESRK